MVKVTFLLVGTGQRFLSSGTKLPSPSLTPMVEGSALDSYWSCAELDSSVKREAKNEIKRRNKEEVKKKREKKHRDLQMQRHRQQTPQAQCPCGPWIPERRPPRGSAHSAWQFLLQPGAPQRCQQGLILSGQGQPGPHRGRCG